MKQNIIACLCISLILFACNKERNSSLPLEVDFSDVNLSNAAKGSIEQENHSGKRFIRKVKSARIIPMKENEYLLILKFKSNDSLRIIFTKIDKDYNYQYPNDKTENQMLYVMFNKDTLALKESAVSIQPLRESNNFVTVTNVHTIYSEEFSGTVAEVPLVRSEKL